METIKVKINEHPELIFHIDISGTSDTITEVRLTVHDDRKVSYLGKYRDGKAHFHVDEIERYFKTGIFKYELEVFIGNQYFIPLAGQIEISDGVKVTAEKEQLKIEPKIEAQLIDEKVTAKHEENKIESKNEEHKKLKLVKSKSKKIAYIVRIP